MEFEKPTKQDLTADYADGSFRQASNAQAASRQNPATSRPPEIISAGLTPP